MQKTLLPKLEMIKGEVHVLKVQAAEMHSAVNHSGMALATVRTELDDCLRILNASHEQPELFGPGGAA